MWRRRQDSERTERARAGLRHTRAKKRARRRLPGSTGPAGIRDRATWLATQAAWLFQQLLWAIQERALWPASDRVLQAADATAWRLEDAAWTVRERLAWPLSDRLERPDGRPAGLPPRPLAGAICAIAVVAMVAGASLAADGGDQGSAVAGPGTEPEPRALAAEEEEPRPAIAQRTEDPPDGPVLSGARPRFEAGASEEVERARRIIAEREAAREAARQEASEAAEEGEDSDAGGGTDGGGAGGSGDSSGDNAEGGELGGSGEAGSGEGAAGDGGDSGADSEGGEVGPGAAEPVPLTSEEPQLTPRDEARRVAHRFTRAFLAYEIGRESEAIDVAFEETASRRLVESLQERPPRLPRDGRVPRAHIVNVVDGPREGRKLEVSVSLLRVNGLSELRLDLFRGSGGWRVGAVKG